MRRVVVTGLGIVSSIGNNADEVTASLRDAKSGISFSPNPSPNTASAARSGARRRSIPTRSGRPARHALPVARAAPWNHVAMEQAIADSGLDESRHHQRAHRHHHGFGRAVHAHHRRSRRHHHARTTARSASVRSRCRRRCRRRLRPRSPPGSRSTASTIRSRRPARHRRIASAMPPRLIQWGKQDMMFAGGHEDLDWTMSNLFDAMGAMSSKFNDRAAIAIARL